MGYTSPLGQVRLMHGSAAYRPSKFNLSEVQLPPKYSTPPLLKITKIKDVEALLPYILPVNSIYLRDVVDKQKKTPRPRWCHIYGTAVVGGPNECLPRQMYVANLISSFTRPMNDLKSVMLAEVCCSSHLLWVSLDPFGGQDESTELYCRCGENELGVESDGARPAPG